MNMGDSDYMKEIYFSIMNDDDEGCLCCGSQYMDFEMIDGYLCTYCADNATEVEE